MKPDLYRLERYFHDTLGLDVATAPWQGADRLPHFLKEAYTFAQMNLLGVRYQLVIDDNSSEASPAIIRKHIDIIRAKDQAEVIYVRQQVTAYNRKRLIEQKVPFIVPGNQLYLPMLAIDLREHFRRIRTEVPTLSPAAQAVVMYALLRNLTHELNPLDTSRTLRYSAMTMSRAFDELESFNLVITTARGRQRCLELAGTKKAVWDKAQPYLRNPVSKTMFIWRGGYPNSIGAGLTALAHYSMLAPPKHTTLAVGREQWRALRQEQRATRLTAGDPDECEIQVWRYDPALTAQDRFVDQLSLYLSLKDDGDERIQAALEEMMGQFKW